MTERDLLRSEILSTFFGKPATQGFRVRRIVTEQNLKLLLSFRLLPESKKAFHQQLSSVPSRDIQLHRLAAMLSRFLPILTSRVDFRYLIMVFPIPGIQ